MPVKGGGGVGGPKKPRPKKSKSSVGAAITKAGSRPAPKPKTSKPGARSTGKAIQQTGQGRVGNQATPSYTLPSGPRGDAPAQRSSGTSPSPERSARAVRGGIRAVYATSTKVERARMRKQGGRAGQAARSQHDAWMRFERLADQGQKLFDAGKFRTGRTLTADEQRAKDAWVKREQKRMDNSGVKQALQGSIGSLSKPATLDEVKDTGSPLEDVRNAIRKGRDALLVGNPVTAGPALLAQGEGNKAVKYVTSGKASEDIRKVTGKATKLSGPAAETAMAGVFPGMDKQSRKALTGIATRTADDLIAFPTDAVQSTATTVKAANEYRKGNKQPAKELWKQVEQGDPSYALGSAAVNLATGDIKGAKSDAQRFGKIAYEHPGLTALSLTGTKGAIGRGAGRVVRGAGAITRSRTLQGVGSVKGRPAAVAPHTNISELRTYSPDLITKGVQAGRDRLGSRKATRLRNRADEAHMAGDERSANEFRRRAAEADPTIISPRAMHRQVDRAEYIGEEVRRQNVAQAEATVNRTQRGVGEQDTATNIAITRGITDATVEDLKAYRNQLAQEYQNLPANKKQANQELRSALDQTINAPDAPERVARLADAARAYSEQVDVPMDKRLTDLGIIDPKRAEKAKLAPVAIREGATVSDKVVPTEAGLVAKASKQASKQAQAALQDAIARYAPEQGAAMPRRGQTALDDLLNADTAAVEAKAAAKAAKLDGRKSKAAAGLVDTEGNKITLSDLKAMTAEKRQVPPSYLPLSPSKPGDFYVATGREPRIGGAKLRGGSIREGTFPVDPEMMTRRAVKSEGLATAAEQYRRNVSEAAVRDNGKVVPLKRGEAEQMAASLTAETGVPYRAVRMNPLGASRKQFENILETLDNAEVDPRSYRSLNETLQAGWEGKGDGDFVVVPEAIAQRQLDHLSRLGMSDVEKAARAARATWSRSVLALSPGPTVSNLFEGTFRMGAAKSGPLDYARAKRAMNAMSPAERQRIEAGLLGGTRVDLFTRTRHTDASQFLDGSAMQKIANKVEGMRRLPVAKQAFAAWDIWTNVVFNYLQRVPERHMKTAHLGQAMKELGFYDGKVIGLSSKAAADAAKGLTGTPAQVRLGRMLDDMHGKYSGFGPNTRYLISNYTPFAAWLASSLNFVYKVMPRDHPMATAMLAGMELATEDARKAMDTPPWGKGNVGLLRVGHNTPFAIGTDGSFAKSLGGIVLPQGSTIQAALLHGEDWKGDKLVHEDGKPYTDAELIGYSAWETLRAALPAVHAVEQGEKYAKKPRTLGSAVLASPPTDEGKVNRRLYQIDREIDELKGQEFKAWSKHMRGRMPKNRYANPDGTPTREARKLLDERKRLRKQRDKMNGVKKGDRQFRLRDRPKSSNSLGGGLGDGGLGGGL